MLMLARPMNLTDKTAFFYPLWLNTCYGLTLGKEERRRTDNRVTNRIFSFLRMVTISRTHLRCRFQYWDESLIIPSIVDLHETLHIKQKHKWHSQLQAFNVY